MIELNIVEALHISAQSLIFASLIYFFYLILKFGEVLGHTAHEGDRRPLREGAREFRLALCQGEPEHGTPAIALEQVAASAGRMVRAAR
jgi:hypothetical protein